MLIWLVTLPLQLGILLVIVFLGFPLALLWIYGYERFVAVRMRTCGRTLSFSRLVQQIGEGSGTLIIESPTAGWSVSRAWWTEDLLDIGGEPWPPNRSGAVVQRIGHPVDRLHHARYTDLDIGSAKLVRA